LLTLKGRKAAEIAAVLGVHISTVRNWRGYFVHGGVAGLRRRQRPGQHAKIARRGGSLKFRGIADLGLTLPEAKQLLACVQQAVVAVQARDHATLRPECASCGERFRIKDWRSRRVATV